MSFTECSVKDNILRAKVTRDRRARIDESTTSAWDAVTQWTTRVADVVSADSFVSVSRGNFILFEI